MQPLPRTHATTCMDPPEHLTQVSYVHFFHTYVGPCIAYNYNFRQLLTNICPDSVAKWSQNRPIDCIQMPLTLSFRELHPRTPASPRGVVPGPPPVAVRRTPGPHADLRSSRFTTLYLFFTGLAPSLQKYCTDWRGDCM